MLASSGEVDMYVMQELLTHKTPSITGRYAHLRDEAIRRAASVAGDLFSKVLNNRENMEFYNQLSSQSFLK
jgi:hypothetical protein